MICDRGNIKWTAMMLPEHVKLLRQFDKTHDIVEKPVLDEQKLDQLNDLIFEAMEFNSLLEFTYYHRGSTETVEGKIHYIDIHKKELRIEIQNGDILRMKLSDIIEIVKI
jgi:YolD-like protein